MSKISPLSVGHRIRELRIERGLTLEQVAERISAAHSDEPPVHFTTIAKIERSQRTISLDWMLKLAAALGVAPAVLVSTNSQVPLQMVPLVGSIAAGNWRDAVAETSEEIAVPGSAGPNAFALRPSGDSMDEVAKDKEILVIDPDQRDLMDGRLFAFMNEFGETTFKQFRADPPRLQPLSSNKEHEAIPLGRDPITVIGRIVFVITAH